HAADRDQSGRQDALRFVAVRPRGAGGDGGPPEAQQRGEWRGRIAWRQPPRDRPDAAPGHARRPALLPLWLSRATKRGPLIPHNHVVARSPGRATTRWTRHPEGYSWCKPLPIRISQKKGDGSGGPPWMVRKEARQRHDRATARHDPHW